MKAYQKVSIHCRFCGNHHKLRLFHFRDKFECPTTGTIFSLDEKFTVHVIESSSGDSNPFKSVLPSDELMPLFDVRLCNSQHQDTSDTSSILKPEQITSEIDPCDDTYIIDYRVFQQVLPDISGIEIPSTTESNRYDIIEKLGEGGFGIVYKGFDRLLHRHVAVKISKSKMDEVQSKVYAEEAKTLAQLNHPNIVQIFDFGLNKDKFCYIIMEHLEYTDFKSFFVEAKDKGSVDFMLTVSRCFAELADALIYLHDKEVFHMDIKPANVLISVETQRAKLVDFGLAKIGKNSSGDFAGTYRYSAPERFKKGFTPNAMSDIYSLGTVFYEVLTNRYANPGSSILDIMGNIFDTNEKAFEDSDDVQIDKMLQEICAKCLAFDPQKRYQNARDLHADLTRFIACHEVVDTPYLYFIEKKRRKTVFPLKKRSFYVGRSFNNDIVILDRNVSRVHALIYIEDDKTYIKNLSEHSAVNVADEDLPYNYSKVLKWNDLIKIADHVFCYVPNKQQRQEQEQNYREAAQVFSLEEQISKDQSARVNDIFPSLKKVLEEDDEDELIMMLRETLNSKGISLSFQRQTTEPAEDIGTKLRNLRKKMGISQLELSQMTGIRQSHISEMETGKREIQTKETAKKIAKVFGIDYKTLL